MKNLGFLLLIFMSQFAQAQQCIVTNKEDNNAPGTLAHCLENTTASVITFSDDLIGDTILLGCVEVSRDLQILGNKDIVIDGSGNYRYSIYYDDTTFNINASNANVEFKDLNLIKAKGIRVRSSTLSNLDSITMSGNDFYFATGLLSIVNSQNTNLTHCNLSLISISQSGYVTVDSTIIHDSPSQGIKIEGSNNCTIKNSIISANGRTNYGYSEGEGIYVYGSSYLTIENNIINNNVKNGILVSNSPTVKMSQNSIYCNGNEGIKVDNQNDFDLFDSSLTIEGNGAMAYLRMASLPIGAESVEFYFTSSDCSDCQGKEYIGSITSSQLEIPIINVSSKIVGIIQYANYSSIFSDCIDFTPDYSACSVFNKEDSDAFGTFAFCLAQPETKIITFDDQLKGDTIKFRHLSVSRSLEIIGDTNIVLDASGCS